MYKAPADLTRVTLDIEGTNRTYEGAIRACADNGREIKDRLESIGLRRESLKTVSQTVKPHYKEISYRDSTVTRHTKGSRTVSSSATC